MTTPETTYIAEPGSHAVTVSAVIAAPLDAVYRAYVEPELFVRWWGPAELQSKIDRWEHVTGGDEGMHGRVCLERHTFESVAGGTKVTQHAVFQSVEDGDGMPEYGMEHHAPVAMAQLQDVARGLY